MGLHWTPSHFHNPGDARPHYGALPPLDPPPASHVNGDEGEGSFSHLTRPTNRSDFKNLNNLLAMADFVFDSYDSDKFDPNRGKIVVYQALDENGHPMRDAQGHPIYVVNITGTEWKSMQRSNTALNWLPGGSGEETDYERQVLAAIQDAVRRGQIPADAVVDLTGHSLGGITANNLSARYDGTIPLGDGRSLPIRNVLGYGTPKPAIWSDKVTYTEVNTLTDPVGNLPTDHFGDQWREHPEGPPHLNRITAHSFANYANVGGHGGYPDTEHPNDLAGMGVPPGMSYAHLKLVAAYRNPASEDFQLKLMESVNALWNDLQGPELIHDALQFADNSIQVVQDAGEAGADATELGFDLWRFTTGDVTAAREVGNDLEELGEDAVEFWNDTAHAVNNLEDMGRRGLENIGTLWDLATETVLPTAINAIGTGAQDLWSGVEDWAEQQVVNVEQAGESALHTAQDLWNAGTSWLGEHLPHF